MTPACDLDNCKVETLTYLPIISVRRLLRSVAFAKVLKREIRRLAPLTGQLAPEWPDDMTLPPLSELEAFREQLARIEDPNREITRAANTCTKAVICLTNITLNRPDDIHLDDLTSALGSKYDTQVSEVVRNQRSDTHFLPCDLEPVSFSAIPEHSVALFRYPLTAPIEILDLANVGNASSWDNAMEKLSETFPIASAFAGEVPLKRGRLLNPFLSDLLTRYVAIYARLGSPDFTSEQLTGFSNEIV